MANLVENRDVLIKADFDQGQWIWLRGESGNFDCPLENGRFYSFGLPVSIQEDLCDWFQSGLHYFQTNSKDWQSFEDKGIELAKSLALQSLQRFNVFYERATHCHDSGMPGIQQIPWEYRTDVPCSLSVPFRQRSMWEGRITICFGPAEYGWVMMAVLCTAYNNHHVIHLSDTFDPFPDLITWVIGIINGKSGTLYIDEEGHGSYLTSRNIDSDWIELIVEDEYYSEKYGQVFPRKRVLAVVNRRSFVAEFYRRYIDFLQHEYDKDGWNRMDPDDYDDDEMAKAMQWQPPGLDIDPIRRYLENCS